LDQLFRLKKVNVDRQGVNGSRRIDFGVNYALPATDISKRELFTNVILHICKIDYLEQGCCTSHAARNSAGSPSLI